VRGDPRITIARADLEARQQALLELHALARPNWEANRAAQQAEARIAAIRETLEKAAGDTGALEAEADSAANRLRDLRSDLQEAGAGVRLSGAIEGATVRPTADQLWQIDRAWQQLPGVVNALNAFVAGPLEDLTAKVYTSAARPAPIAAVTLPARR
jgi:chromosome segregation ATPase